MPMDYARNRVAGDTLSRAVDPADVEAQIAENTRVRGEAKMRGAAMLGAGIQSAGESIGKGLAEAPERAARRKILESQSLAAEAEARLAPLRERAEKLRLEAMPGQIEDEKKLNAARVNEMNAIAGQRKDEADRREARKRLAATAGMTTYDRIVGESGPPLDPHKDAELAIESVRKGTWATLTQSERNQLAEGLSTLGATPILGRQADPESEKMVGPEAREYGLTPEEAGADLSAKRQQYLSSFIASSQSIADNAKVEQMARTYGPKVAKVSKNAPGATDVAMKMSREWDATGFFVVGPDGTVFDQPRPMKFRDWAAMNGGVVQPNAIVANARAKARLPKIVLNSLNDPSNMKGAAGMNEVPEEVEKMPAHSTAWKEGAVRGGVVAANANLQAMIEAEEGLDGVLAGVGGMTGDEIEALSTLNRIDKAKTLSRDQQAMLLGKSLGIVVGDPAKLSGKTDNLMAGDDAAKYSAALKKVLGSKAYADKWSQKAVEERWNKRIADTTEEVDVPQKFSLTAGYAGRADEAATAASLFIESEHESPEYTNGLQALVRSGLSDDDAHAILATQFSSLVEVQQAARRATYGKSSRPYSQLTDDEKAAVDDAAEQSWIETKIKPFMPTPQTFGGAPSKSPELDRLNQMPFGATSLVEAEKAGRDVMERLKIAPKGSMNVVLSDGTKQIWQDGKLVSQHGVDGKRIPIPGDAPSAQLNKKSVEVGQDVFRHSREQLSSAPEGDRTHQRMIEASIRSGEGSKAGIDGELADVLAFKSGANDRPLFDRATELLERKQGGVTAGDAQAMLMQLSAAARSRGMTTDALQHSLNDAADKTNNPTITALAVALGDAMSVDKEMPAREFEVPKPTTHELEGLRRATESKKEPAQSSGGLNPAIAEAQQQLQSAQQQGDWEANKYSITARGEFPRADNFTAKQAVRGLVRGRPAAAYEYGLEVGNNIISGVAGVAGKIMDGAAAAGRGFNNWFDKD